MAITLNVWQPAPNKPVRLYLNGLDNQRRENKAWLAEFQGTAHPYFEGCTDTQVQQAAEWFNAQNKDWPVMLALAQKTPALIPAPVVDRTPAIRAALMASSIVHVAPAARMAGLSFRNGLSKVEIIDRLCSDPEMAARALENITRLRAGNIAPPAPVKADWIDDDDIPAPTQAPTVKPSQAIDLSAYALKTEVSAEVIKLARSVREARENADAGIAALDARISADLDALKQNRPLELIFPELPAPIKVPALHHPQFADLVLTLQCKLHAMLVGPAGSSKTFSSEQAAEALSLRFYMQGAISYAHELLGYVDAHSRYVRTQFREAFEHGGLILLDEFDASAAEAALVLNAALANGACAFPDGLIRKHADFRCIVGANTDGSGATMQYAGRARLDGAFLDRFVNFDWQIDPRIEDHLSKGNSRIVAAVRAVREFAHKRGILDVVATPRAIAFGATLAARGMAPSLVLERTMKRGALVECWRDVLRLDAVVQFLA
jgi:MoxR-like ATPase